MRQSKTFTKIRTKKKTNSELVETIALALKNKAWNSLAHKLSGATRSFSAVNLDKIEKETKAGDTIIIPGKVLSKGNVTKKVRLCALSFSETAIEKLKATKSEVVLISEEIKKNPKATGVRVIQ